MDAQALYDQIGVGYDATRRADPSIVRMLSEAIGAPPRSVLDVGCGTGNYTAALADHGFAVSGVDPSSTMLDAANEKRPGLNWIKASADNLPFPIASFNAVTAVNVVHHFRAGNEFEEIRRVTSAGRKLAESWLHHAGLPIPNVFVAAEDVAAGKPDPSGFLLAASRLGFQPHETIVFEDAPAGLEAGRRAGAKVIAVATMLSRSELAAHDWIPDFSRIEFTSGFSGSPILKIL